LCRAPSAHEKKGRGGGLGHWGRRSFGTGKEGREEGEFLWDCQKLIGWFWPADPPHTCSSKRVLLVRGKRRKKRGMRELAELAKRRPAGAENSLDGPLLVGPILLKTKQLRHPQRVECLLLQNGKSNGACAATKRRSQTNDPTQMFSRHCQLPLAFLASGSIFANQPRRPSPILSLNGPRGKKESRGQGSSGGHCPHSQNGWKTAGEGNEVLLPETQKQSCILKWAGRKEGPFVWKAAIRAEIIPAGEYAK